jgi:hypothetical protein
MSLAQDGAQPGDPVARPRRAIWGGKAESWVRARNVRVP